MTMLPSINFRQGCNAVVLQYAEPSGLKKYRFILEDSNGHRYRRSLVCYKNGALMHFAVFLAVYSSLLKNGAG